MIKNFSVAWISSAFFIRHEKLISMPLMWYFLEHHTHTDNNDNEWQCRQ